MKHTTTEILYFIVIFILFFLITKFALFINTTNKINIDLSLLISSLIFTGLIIVFYYLSGLTDCTDHYGIMPNSNMKKNVSSPTVGNDLFQVTPGKLYRGGAYMFQGNSPQAKGYRKFVESPEGKEQLNRYQCSGFPGLYNGYPGKDFVYSSQSDDSWSNSQCNTLGVISPNGIF